MVDINLIILNHFEYQWYNCTNQKPDIVRVDQKTSPSYVVHKKLTLNMKTHIDESNRWRDVPRLH